MNRILAALLIVGLICNPVFGQGTERFSGSVPVSTSQGGTGVDSSGVTDGQILIGQTSGHTFGLATITGTAPVSITNAGHSITVSVPVLVGDSGSGGTAGLVPAPASGDAAASKFLKADGTWASAPAATLGAVVNAGAIVNSVAVSAQITWTSGSAYTTTLPEVVGPPDVPLIFKGGQTNGTSSSASVELMGSIPTEGQGGGITLLAGTAATLTATAHNGGTVNITAGGACGTSTGAAVNITGGAGDGPAGGFNANAGGVINTGGTGAGNGGGGAIQNIGGVAGATGVGGAITIRSGAGGVTSGISGAISITTGNTSDGNVGQLSLTGGDALTSTSTNRNGGNIVITGGKAALTGTSGAVQTTGGAAATGSGGGGGAITTTSGAGDGAGLSGAATFRTGSGGATGNSGTTTITTGAGGATSGNSGGLTLSTGSVTDGNGGAVSITAGSGATTTSTSRTGGNVTITSGSGGASGGNSGIASLNGGAAGSGGGGVGGTSRIVGGTGDGAGNGGPAAVTGGVAGASGTGGTAALTGGAGVAGAGGAASTVGGAGVGTDQASGGMSVDSGASTGVAAPTAVTIKGSPKVSGGVSGSGNNASVVLGTFTAVQNNLASASFANGAAVKLANVTFGDGAGAGTGSFCGVYIAPTLNYTNGTKAQNFTGLIVNQTHTSAPTGTLNLIDLQLAGVSKFAVSSAGALTLGGAAPSSVGSAPTHAQTLTIGCTEELLTLSTVGLTTDTSANLLPAGALILSVDTRVTTTITTTTNWAVGDGTTSARFSSANATLTSGTTQVGINQANGGVAAGAGMMQTAAAKVRITCTGSNPGAGIVRITVHYIQLIAPTS